jgi:tryptophan-rich sensory protein
MENTLGFFGFCAAATAVASTGAIFRPGEWYKGLKKPSWRPVCTENLISSHSERESMNLPQ